MSNSFSKSKGMNRSTLIIILLVYNIIIYLYPFLLVGPFAASIWVHMLPWTLIILLSISIVHIIIDNDIERVSIKPNTYLILLSLGIQILAAYVLMFVYSTSPYPYYLYHFLMLISLIVMILAYYINYKNSNIITESTESTTTPEY
jgi:hypothetical protein